MKSDFLLRVKNYADACIAQWLAENGGEDNIKKHVAKAGVAGECASVERVRREVNIDGYNVLVKFSATYKGNVEVAHPMADYNHPDEIALKFSDLRVDVDMNVSVCATKDDNYLDLEYSYGSAD